MFFPDLQGSLTNNSALFLQGKCGEYCISIYIYPIPPTCFLKRLSNKHGPLLAMRMPGGAYKLGLSLPLFPGAAAPPGPCWTMGVKCFLKLPAKGLLPHAE